MSTSSRIAVVNTDNTVSSTYCHYDGYIDDGVGEMLAAYWNDHDVLTEAIKQGEVRTWGSSIESNSHFSDSMDCRLDMNRDEFWESAFDCGEEYVYLFDDGVWYYLTSDSKIIKKLPKPNMEVI